MQCWLSVAIVARDEVAMVVEDEKPELNLVSTTISEISETIGLCGLERDIPTFTKIGSWRTITSGGADGARLAGREIGPSWRGRHP